MASNDEDNDDEAVSATTADDRKSKTAEPAGKDRLLDRWLLNLRVWVPALRTPAMKGRQVKYRSSDARSGMTWKIAMPRQCYACGKTDDLTLRKFSEEVRVYDAPTAIMGSTLAAVTLVLLLAVFRLSFPFFILAVVIGLMGAAFQFIKSWTERVKINLFSCPEHLDDLTPPEVVSYDDDLYVYVPHESLTEPARAELIESRKKGQKQRPPLANDQTRAAGSGSAVNEPVPNETAEPAPIRPIITRQELPPLKLAGDEDE
ncbi:MAG TPA: hypothetical protein VHC22_09625 [Pirellulales bacterium]|nr:hypothetical protein [Pirellulales bacterium]